jgi:hypothetical protein
MLSQVINEQRSILRKYRSHWKTQCFVSVFKISGLGPWDTGTGISLMFSVWILLLGWDPDPVRYDKKNSGSVTLAEIKVLHAVILQFHFLALGNFNKLTFFYPSRSWIWESLPYMIFSSPFFVLIWSFPGRAHFFLSPFWILWLIACVETIFFST